MSLINDALKRASQAKPSPPAHQQSEPQLQPVEHKRSPVVPLLFLLPVLLLVLALAGWLFIKAWRTESTPKFSPIKLPVSAREAPAAQPIGSFGAPQQNNGFKPEPPSPQPAGSATRMAEASVPAPASAPTNPPIATADPPPPSFPSVRLQGVFFRLTHPQAMINSKTVSVGDKIANTKVIAITRDSVTLQWNGETKVLTLEP